MQKEKEHEYEDCHVSFKVPFAYVPPSNVTFPRSATEVCFVIDVYNATGTKTVVLGTYTGNLILSFAAVQFYSYLLSHSVSDSHQEATVD